jgi:type I restriction enzyme M protein
MPLKKSELYSSIWASCDNLRGGMDASQYKDYVLVLLFVKYVSDKYAGRKNALIEVPAGGSFADMVALKGKKDIGDGMNKIISKLAEANDLKGVIDLTDFNDEDKLGKGQEMVDRLSKLVGIFENPALDFSRNRAEGDDLLGDAYEYLMRHFATESGKSKGQFYTPAEVSIVMAKVIGIANGHDRTKTLYDPTCGSGSLLLKAADEAHDSVTIYGQEMDNATSALAKMNMILHDNPTATIWKDNTLSTPYFKNADGSLKTFDFVVANFPFSTKAWSNGFNPAEDLYGRFEDGIPPQKNGDYAFLLHILKSMKSTGKGAVILPHGVLFRGGAEGQIRKNLIRKGFIKGIIGLPANLFYGTGIPACILVLDKENAAGRAGIFMLDASKGFVKDGNKNRLRHQDIHKIVDVFNRQQEIPKYARMVPLAEISDPKNEFNLNIPRYVDNTDEEDRQDIAAHLLGGVPEADLDRLAGYWEAFPALRLELFGEGPRPGYSAMRVEAGQVKALIFSHPEFTRFHAAANQRFTDWMGRNRPALAGLEIGSHPRALIEALGEDLLAAFADTPLVDRYDIYQGLMIYWAESMQDDVYMLVTEGWQANPELIPPALLIGCYFKDEQAAVDALQAEQETLNAQMEELNEEYGIEDGLLDASKNDKGKITKASLKERLGQVSMTSDQSPEEREEADLLNRYLRLMDAAAEAGKQAKEAQKALDEKVKGHYALLNPDEIKTLLIDDKWLASLAAQVDAQAQAIAAQLAGRLKELGERYAAPLPALTGNVDALSARVDSHLQKMGFLWK